MSARRYATSSPATRAATHLALALVSAIVLASVAAAQDEGQRGITKPVVLPPFNPRAPACSAPHELTRSLAFVQENEREFLQGVDHGLRAASKDRMLAYHRIVVDNDVGKVIGGIDDLRTQQIGAVIATSSDPVMIAPSLRRALRAGIFVGTIVPPPATLILNAPQYATGKALTEAAIVHIKAKLGGKANVVLLTQDSMQYLAPRFQAMRDGFDALPGASIVADLAPAPVTKASGYATMQKILIAHPRVDVVLGGDAVVLGALEALRAAGKDRPDQFLGGIDGEPEGVAEIKKGNSPFKASIALSSPVFGYAMGQFAGDWLDGKSIPQAMDILPIALTSGNIAAYEADLADPGAVFAEPSRREAYLRMYGNICYDTRDRYLDFPWSSE